jgi:hypothetical protein
MGLVLLITAYLLCSFPLLIKWGNRDVIPMGVFHKAIIMNAGLLHNVRSDQYILAV